MKSVTVGVALAVAAVAFAPTAHAGMQIGNYELNIVGRYDFHTWVFAVSACPSECVLVSALARPIARAHMFRETAQLADGRYTLVVDDPFGLRCGNVYYGPTIPTHDVYTWDAVSLAGSMESSFATGCDGAPGGTFTYPFNLTRL